MIHSTLIFAACILLCLSSTLANPCSYGLVLDEPSAMSMGTDPSSNVLFDDESVDEYLEQLAASNTPTTDRYQELADTAAAYPSMHHQTGLENDRKRFKRPSWATVGKRSAMLVKKRPSWAQVG